MTAWYSSTPRPRSSRASHRTAQLAPRSPSPSGETAITSYTLHAYGEVRQIQGIRRSTVSAACQTAAELASQAASVAGVRGAALDFTRELVKRIPIVPVDAS